MIGTKDSLFTTWLRNGKTVSSRNAAAQGLPVSAHARHAASGPFRVGRWVRVRPLDEILATLDDDASVDGMPFMPEMVRYCGQTLQIVKSAHKACDPTGATDMRALPDTVHLDTRCDGSGHDGCEARCRLFWKTAWLIPVESGPAVSLSGTLAGETPPAAQAVLDKLYAATRQSHDGEIRYRCQATQIVHASQEIGRCDFRQYVDDITRGNVAWAQLLVPVSTAAKALLRRLRSLGRSRHATGDSPAKPGKDDQTATGTSIRPGEMVRVKSAEKIIATLDATGKHHGLILERQMLDYCNKTYRVVGRVDKLIDERSGRMVTPKHGCILLDGIVCQGLDNHRRLFCPRAPFLFWREAWLERIPADSRPEGQH